MKFIISFVYMDGENFEVEVAEGDMESFVSALGKNEVFFNDSAGVGIFIPVDKIRYFQVERVDGEGRRIVESDCGVPHGDGGAESGEAQSEKEGAQGVGQVVPALEGDAGATGTDDGLGGRS